MFSSEKRGRSSGYILPRLAVKNTFGLYGAFVILHSVSKIEHLKHTNIT